MGKGEVFREPEKIGELKNRETQGNGEKAAGITVQRELKNREVG